MAKFFGQIGFAVTTEPDPINHPGVFLDDVVERDYFGDIIRNNARWDSASQANDNFNLDCQFSILLDPFAEQNCQKIVYIKHLGERWKVKTINLQYPRLLLTVGGIYNGEQANTASGT